MRCRSPRGNLKLGWNYHAGSPRRSSNLRLRSPKTPPGKRPARPPVASRPGSGDPGRPGRDRTRGRARSVRGSIRATSTPGALATLMGKGHGEAAGGWPPCNSSLRRRGVRTLPWHMLGRREAPHDHRPSRISVALRRSDDRVTSGRSVRPTPPSGGPDHPYTPITDALQFIEQF
jgi:hypothetical protein